MLILMWNAELSFMSQPDHVEVQYRTKVVKYTWPHPYHVSESIPWVQVTLANGKTLHTKLLVCRVYPVFHLILQTEQLHNQNLEFLKVVVIGSFRLVLMGQTQWCGEKRASPRSNGITISQQLSLFSICLRYDDPLVWSSNHIASFCVLINLLNSLIFSETCHVIEEKLTFI